MGSPHGLRGALWGVALHTKLGTWGSIGPDPSARAGGQGRTLKPDPCTWDQMEAVQGPEPGPSILGRGGVGA